MAETITLEARERVGFGTANSRRLRREGLIPAVLYGKKIGNLNLVVERRAFESVMRHRGRILDVRLPDGRVEKAIIKEVQFDPFGEEVLHVDFGRVALDEKIEVKVGLKLVGEPKGTAASGHLDVALYELRVECLAGNIPEAVKFDVSNLQLDQFVRVRDLAAPEGARILDDPETVVLHLAPAREVEEIAAPAPAEVGAAEPEVIAKGKKVEKAVEAEE